MKTKKIIILCIISLISILISGCNKCEHDWTIKSNTATCCENGIKISVCSICGKEKKEKIKKENGEHSYEFVQKVDPTKYYVGYDLLKCSLCGKEKHENNICSLESQCEEGFKTHILPEIKSNLIDPTSLLYKVTAYATDFENRDMDNKWDCRFIYEIAINAKNKFGGYTGYQNKYYYFRFCETIEGGANSWNYRYNYNETTLEEALKHFVDTVIWKSSNI